MTPRARFPSLAKLVQHYSNDADGMCCVLTHPYGTAEQLIMSGHNHAEDAQEISGGAPKLNSRQGSGQEQTGEGTVTLMLVNGICVLLINN